MRVNAPLMTFNPLTFTKEASGNTLRNLEFAPNLDPSLSQIKPGDISTFRGEQEKGSCSGTR